MAAYVAFRVPAEPIARVYAAVAVLATYIIVRRIASRVAMDLLPRGAGATHEGDWHDSTGRTPDDHAR